MATVPALESLIGSKRRDILIVLSLQTILLVLFGFLARYSDDHGKLKIYPMFQDVHVMIFVGFGFLMTFLKRYGFSSVGFNFLLASLIVQWALICEGLYEMDENFKIRISIQSLLDADVAAAAVLISMGAVLGRTSYVQLLVMGVIEIAVFTGNSYLGSEVFKVTDAGDSIFVHAFGAYFGLAVSYVLERRGEDGDSPEEGNDLEGSSYNSDLFAMIGTVFLWMFWPSFNSATLTDDEQHRAVINTYLSLASCCVISFAMSAAFSEDHKFDMVHIQNSTLAGGVAVGTAANLMLQPYGALLVGILAGSLSVFGYSVLTPALVKKFRLRDTCGVHNLHGMPAILAGLVGALMAGIATEDQYKMTLYQVFPARAPPTLQPTSEYTFLAPGDGRSAWEQAGYQLLAVAVTVVVAVVSGLITGFVISGPLTTRISSRDAYRDDIYWILHEHTAVEVAPESVGVEGATRKSPSAETLPRNDELDTKI